MERAYNLEPNEAQQQQQLADEHQRVLAEFGGLTLQMENVRTRIPQVEQRQRELINQVAQRHGVTNFVAARIVGKNLVCMLPDEPAVMDPRDMVKGLPTLDIADVPAGPPLPLRVNGKEIGTKE